MVCRQERCHQVRRHHLHTRTTAIPQRAHRILGEVYGIYGGRKNPFRNIKGHHPQRLPKRHFSTRPRIYQSINYRQLLRIVHRQERQARRMARHMLRQRHYSIVATRPLAQQGTHRQAQRPVRHQIPGRTIHRQPGPPLDFQLRRQFYQDRPQYPHTPTNPYTRRNRATCGDQHRGSGHIRRPRHLHKPPRNIEVLRK